MKKLLAVAAIAGAVSTMSVESYAVKGEVSLGVEYEDYNGGYNADDFVLPYVAGKIYPKDGSPLYLYGKYSYRKHDDDDKYRTDKRRRYEFYTGYSWKWDNFAFTPKAGLRYEDYSDEASTDELFKWRFYPNMSYKVNDKTSAFLSGFVSYVDKEKNNDDKIHGYNHELEAGTKYTLPNGQTLQTSIYSEYYKENDISSTEEWQLRFKYSHRVTEKTTLTPWVRIGLDKEQRDKSGKGHKDRLRHRIGLTAKHNVTPTFSIFGEVNWQTENVEAYSNEGGKSAEDKNRTVYKLGITQKF